VDCIIDLREYDVPYHVRFAIDNGNFILFNPGINFFPFSFISLFFWGGGRE